MKTEEIKINKITADDGHVFAAADKTQVFGKEMYLAVNDSAENYIEITDEEAEEIRNESVSPKLKI